MNFFENAYRVAVTEDVCEECSSQLLDVNFNKVNIIRVATFQFCDNRNKVFRFSKKYASKRRSIIFWKKIQLS